MEETHDRILERKGTFKTAIAAIKKAKSLGFRVCTNTTIFKETDLVEIDMLFSLLTDLKVDGILVAPGFGYEAVGEKLFLERREIERKFEEVYEMSMRFRFYSTPMYLKFLKGERKLECTPWGNPTRNTRGWKAPCYLITDAHYPSYREMMEKTRVGQVRGRQGRALRPVHDALRLRAVGGNRGGEELEGHLGDGALEHDLDSLNGLCRYMTKLL